MKYVRGNQTYKLDDMPMLKVNVVADGQSEGPWVRQASDHVVMLNHLICFYPFYSWGTILPSKNPPGDLRETIDVSKIRGDSPDETELTLHPEAWDVYLKIGYINDQGEIIAKEDKMEIN